MTKKVWMKTLPLGLIVFSMMLFMPSADAQVFGNLKQAATKAKQAVTKTEQKVKQTEVKAEHLNNTATKQGDVLRSTPLSVKSGKTYYVSVTTGSVRGAGTKESPFKDLQKAMDTAEEGATLCIAEGNYLGNLDRGYLEMKKYLTLKGGYSADFSKREPTKYITKVQPGLDQVTTCNHRGIFNIDVTTNANGLICIDGIVFDGGEINKYCAPIPENEITGTPEGCLTGRIIPIPDQPRCPTVGGRSADQYLFRGTMKGKLIITNCAFINSVNFGIQLQQQEGNIEIYNNVFVSNRMAACQILGNTPQMDKINIDFHHNTVMFTWCRTKHMEDMGYGYRYFSGIKTTDVHHNIFGCTNHAALDLTHFDSDKSKEAQRVRNAYDNYFFANKADLEIAGNGGTAIFVKSERFEEVELLNKYENNKDFSDKKFISIIDQPYLKGYMSLSIMSSQNYDPNSSANQLNRLFGQNQTGTEIVRVSMFGNKYPWEKALDFFGAVKGYGAQACPTE